MNAKEIIDKFKDVLFSAEIKDEEVVLATEIADIEVKEEIVELAEEPVAEVEQAPIEEVKEDFATKRELSEAIAMFKSMFEQLADSMNQNDRADVPKELSKEVVEELSAQDVEPLTHTPEIEVEKNSQLFSQKRASTTLDVVMNKLFKN